MAPRSDAVRLVDRDDAESAARVQRAEPGKQPAQRLGAHVHELELAREGRALDCCVGLCTAQEADAQSVLLQRLHLVAHERDEWRDDERGATREQRRKLEARALAASRPRQDHNVTASTPGLQRPPLERAQLREV
eukprot:720690-Prymnesium_polylepis.2